MKKTLQFFGSFFLVFFSAFSLAQPQYFNYDAANGTNNGFPFNVSTGKTTQNLYLPGAFTQPAPAPSGDITKIYFQVNTGGSATYSQLIIKMGLTTDTDLPAGAWFTGNMVTVFDSVNFNLSGTAGQFAGITLETPFAYDNTQSLVVEVTQCGHSGSGIIIRWTSGGGIKRNAGPLTPGSCPHFWGNQQDYSTHTGLDINTTVGIDPISGNVPGKFLLEQNYPNPFNPVTSIRFSIPKPGFVTLKVYGAIGNLVEEAVSQHVNAGAYEVKFDASGLSSGIYFYTLISGDFTETKKMALIK